MVIQETLDFVQAMLSDYEEIKSNFNHELLFDIGISCGESWSSPKKLETFN